VVDAVADEGDTFAALLELLHHLRFLFGRDFGEHVLNWNADLLCDGGSGEWVVSGNEISRFSVLLELCHDFSRVWLDDIAQRQQTEESGVSGQAEDGSALSGPISNKRGTRFCIGIG